MLAVDIGFAGSFVDLRLGVFFLQTEQALQAPQRGITAFSNQRVRPAQGVVSHADYSITIVANRFCDAATATANSENLAELAFFKTRVDGDLLHLWIKDTNHGAVPTSPDALADILSGHLIVRSFDLDVAVAVNATAAFLEAWKEARGQWLQRRLLVGLEVCAHLTLRRSVDALVRNISRPPAQMRVHLGEALKDFALQGVVLDVFDAGFDLAPYP